MHPGQKMKPGTRASFGEPPARLEVEVLAQHTFGRRTIRLWRLGRRQRRGGRRRHRPHAAAAVHQARRQPGRSRALSDHLRKPPRIGRGADGGPASHDRACSIALEARGVHARRGHAARRLRHVRAGADRRRRRAPPPSRALRDRRAPRPPPSRPPSTRAGASSASAPPPRARSKRWPPHTAASSTRPPARRRLYIYPGFRFQVVGGLLTNFHLPKSSLAAAGVCVCRDRADACGLPARDRRGLPVLQLRGRDADPVNDELRVTSDECEMTPMDR